MTAVVAVDVCLTVVSLTAASSLHNQGLLKTLSFVSLSNFPSVVYAVALPLAHFTPPVLQPLWGVNPHTNNMVPVSIISQVIRSWRRNAYRKSNTVEGNFMVNFMDVTVK